MFLVNRGTDPLFRIGLSSRLAPSNLEEAQGLLDALQQMLAEVAERYAGGGPSQLPHGGRDDRLARRRRVSDAGGDVHGTAIDVVAFVDDVAGVKADVEREAGLLCRRMATTGAVDRLPR